MCCSLYSQFKVKRTVDENKQNDFIAKATCNIIMGTQAGLQSKENEYR